MLQLFVFVELEPLFYHFRITKTLNLSNEKWKLGYLRKYPSRKILNDIWDNNIQNLQDYRGRSVVVFILIEVMPFFSYFMITKTLNLSNEKWKLS